jgi:hypothetical protein
MSRSFTKDERRGILTQTARKLEDYSRRHDREINRAIKSAYSLDILILPVEELSVKTKF